MKKHLVYLQLEPFLDDAIAGAIARRGCGRKAGRLTILAKAAAKRIILNRPVPTIIGAAIAAAVDAVAANI